MQNKIKICSNKIRVNILKSKYEGTAEDKMSEHIMNTIERYFF